MSSDSAKTESSNVVPFRDSRAGHAIDDVASVVRDHPFLVIAGGIAVGVAIAALLPKRSNSATGRLSRGARHLAEAAGAASLALGREVLEKGSHAREAARDTGRDLGLMAKDRAAQAGTQLRRQGEAALDRAEDALGAAGDASQKLLRKATELAGEIRGRVRR